MIYFFDDQSLDARVGMRRDYEIPEFIPASTYRDPSDYAVSPGFPTVFYSEKLGEYIMIYNVMEPDDQESLDIFICAAHSKDLESWEALDTRELCDIPNRKLFNQIFPVMQGECYCYEDKTAPSEERYKLLYCRYAPNLRMANEIYVSPDLFSWKKLEGVTWNEQGAEPGLGCFYSEKLKKHVITCRPHWADRRVCITMTEDFRTFTPLSQILTTDSMDEPLSEAYGMPCFQYKDIVIGFLWKFFRPQDTSTVSVGNQLINNSGRLEPELVYSKNGQYFQRSLRKSFIPKNDPSKPYYGCLYPSSIVETDDDIRIFASCSQGEHYDFRKRGIGSIVSFKIKKDRFIYLEGNSAAYIRTRNLLIEGPISVNAHIFEKMRCRLIGSDGVEVAGFGYDDFDAFSGDSTDYVLTWQGKDTSSLKGKTCSLEISLMCGRLYAIKGDFKVLAFNQTRLYNTFGTLDEDI